ncbi:unnamed protein product [Plutella xylostella]|uniref:(diamondback moth) hypothetical protein n=1 Tax=Plutella xylostella TaxID=51655 RepID=A0A8S4DP39_PLUXY|nr:unnamed protein product [Plutella xylostella]
MASSTFSSLKSASESSAAALAAAQARFLAVSAGREGGGDSLQDQLMAAKQEASEASTLVSQSSMQKKHCEERLRALEKEYKNTAGRHDQDQKDIDRLQAQVDALQRELSSLDYSEERHSSLKESCRSLQASIRQKRDAVDNLSARLQRCDFKYTDPEPNFDRKRVCGTVCRLMTVKDPVYCTAIETAAGGRLYNVVVDTEVTSKLILQRGRLEARTTLVPLNKIHAACIDDRTVRAAQEHGGGPDNVQLALDLVTYPAHCAPALRWVLGNTLVCKDLQTAKRVTYHPSVMKRCVTLDGDVFDPSGTLSGGARAKGGSILLQLQQLRELEASLSEAEEQYRRVSEELGQSQRLADKYTAAMQRYEMSSHELSVLKQRVASTAHAHLHADIAALRAQVTDLAAAIAEQERTKAEAAARAKELEAKVKDIKGHREREFKKAQAELDAAKKEAEKHSEDWKRREQEFETLTLEVRELEAGVAAARAQLAELDEALATLQQQEDAAQAAHAEAQSAVKELQARIKQQKADMSRRSGEVTRLLQHKESLAKSCSELELGIKELQYKITELEGEASDCEKRIKALEAEHPWIPSEREYFGQAGGAFDFARGGAAAAARVAQLTARRDKLQRGLNHRAHTLLGKEEEQYQDVMRKKQIVEADRAKLVQVMAELDQKKRSTLLAACSQVNKSFASIFSTLLPGAQASLAPPPGLTVLDGLEVKVGFNNTWKESLGELSGGQRSLVALALVLAMLQFKPAPLYILDEVDAALDLSHTQNIGQMLKEHFTASQFIIVSLKDGMFNNANVLFRTRFVDGMSAVQRTVNRR